MDVVAYFLGVEIKKEMVSILINGSIPPHRKCVIR